MIHQSVIDPSMNRLSAHFGARVVVRPPATAADLADLEAAVGTLPRDLVIFFVTCNGLRIAAEGIQAELHLWHIHEIMAVIRECEGAPVATGLLPMRGDRSGARDCLVLAPGPAHGMVVRRDPWVPGVDLLSSTFGKYVDAWTSYLVEKYDTNGQPNPNKAKMPFDPVFTATLDTDVVALRLKPDMQNWLRGLDSTVSSGADFE